MVPSTVFGRIGRLRDPYLIGRAGFVVAFAIITITTISAVQNHNGTIPSSSGVQISADFAKTKTITHQQAAGSFQSLAVTSFGNFGSREPAYSTRQNNAHSAQNSLLNSESLINDKLAATSLQSASNENTGLSTLNSVNDLSRNADNGWQYCLAASRADHKVYISPPFPKTAQLNIIAIAFSQRLLEHQHEAVQCPVSKYKGSIATMREDAIGYNRKIGNTIVTLNWQPFSVSDDEDPIDATIYTGASGINLDRPGAWQYCLAPSYADNKVYISAPFPKSVSLHANEKAFARKLHESKIQHGAVQCPNGSDEPSLLSMRQRAISFNEDRGNTIVTLGWTHQSQSGS
jgi:hypothetical protein